MCFLYFLHVQFSGWEAKRHSKIAILAIKISMKNSKKTSRDDIQGGVIQISREDLYLFLKLQDEKY